jgi:HEAT repeat protein
MTRFLIVISVFLIPFLTGCGRKEPVQAYGKPVGHWLAELKKQDSKTRGKAVRALGQIGMADPEAIPALVGAVKDQDAAVKERAIMALLQIGPPAKEAIPALTEAKIDADPSIRAQAQKALERIQSGQ